MKLEKLLKMIAENDKKVIAWRKEERKTNSADKK